MSRSLLLAVPRSGQLVMGVGQSASPTVCARACAGMRCTCPPPPTPNTHTNTNTAGVTTRLGQIGSFGGRPTRASSNAGNLGRLRARNTTPPPRGREGWFWPATRHCTPPALICCPVAPSRCRRFGAAPAQGHKYHHRRVVIAFPSSERPGAAMCTGISVQGGSQHRGWEECTGAISCVVYLVASTRAARL